MFASLTDGYIWIGNSFSLPQERLLSGDITVTNAGVTSISAGVIVNADINASAGIVQSKLAPLTTSRVVVTNASTGFKEASPITTTELNSLSGIDSNIQDQLDDKQDIITGAASTITTLDLSANRAVISDGSGKISESSTSATQISYLSTTTSDVQVQLDSKLSAILTAPADGDMLIYSGGTYINLAIGSPGEVLSVSGGSLPYWTTGTSNSLPAGGTTAQVLRKASATNYDTEWHTLLLADITDVSASAADVNLLVGLSSSITSLELSYVAGLTDNIQLQLDNKQSRSLAYNALWVGNGANQAAQLAAGSNDQVLTIIGGTPQWTTQTPPGDVSGPVSSTDNAIARWNGTLGDSIQDSGIIIDDTNNITGVISLQIENQGSLKLEESGGANYVALRASSAMASDYTITLPSAAPASGTYLKYNGSSYVWDVSSVPLNNRTETGTAITASVADDNYIVYCTAATDVTITMDDAVTANVTTTYVKAGAGDLIFVSDGTSVLNTINNETTITEANGSATWVKRNSTEWFGWGALGDSVVYVFDNGITETAGTVELGGSLTGDTVIDGVTNTHSITFNALSTFNVDASSFVFTGDDIYAYPTGGFEFVAEGGSTSYLTTKNALLNIRSFNTGSPSELVELHFNATSLPFARFEIYSASGTATTIRDAVIFRKSTTASQGVNNQGFRLAFDGESSTSGTYSVTSGIEFKMTDVTVTSEDAEYTWSTVVAGADTDIWRLKGTGTEYFADHSAANAANPRWIPDKAYVDSLAGGGISDGDKGDITVSASGATWTIDIDSVTYSKMQNVSTNNRFLGRITGGAGNPEELTGTQATTILDTFTSALKGLAPASGGGSTAFLRADGTWAVPGVYVTDGDKGDITVASSGAAWSVDVDIAKAWSGVHSFTNGNFRLYNPANTFYYSFTTSAIAANRAITIPLLTGGDTLVMEAFAQTLTNKTLTSPIITTSATTGSTTFTFINTTATTVSTYGAATTFTLGGTPTGSLTANFFNNATTTGNTKVINIGTSGDTGSTTNIVLGTDVSGSTSTTTVRGTLILPNIASDGSFSTSSLIVRDASNNVETIAASGGGSTNFLRADGTWAVPPGSGGVSDGDKGDITVSASGATWTIDTDAVTFSKTQNIATSRILGRVTASSGNIEELTGTQATTLLDVFTSGLQGVVPASGGGTTNFLRADGTWTAPPGGGGGATLTGSANEVIKYSSSTSGIGTKVFSATDGNLTLGDTGLAGDRTIATSSSATDAALYINSKGASKVFLNGDGTNTGGLVVGLSSVGYGGIGGMIHLGTTTDSSGTERVITTMGAGTAEVLTIHARGTSGSIKFTSANVGLSFGSGNTPQNEGIYFQDTLVSLWGDNTVTTAYEFRGKAGVAAQTHGKQLTIAGGAGYGTTGNGNGGNVLLKSGLRRTAGSGVDGDIHLDYLTGNLGLGTNAGSFGSGKGVVFLANATTTPSGTPTGGIIAYADAGVFKIKDTTGNVIALGIPSNKSITLQSPTNAENASWFYTERALLITKVTDVVRGSSTPSVTWNIRSATTRDSGSPTDVFTSNRTTTSTSGANTTTINNATIAAGSYVWVITSAVSGTVNELMTTIVFNEL